MQNVEQVAGHSLPAFGDRSFLLFDGPSIRRPTELGNQLVPILFNYEPY